MNSAKNISLKFIYYHCDCACVRLYMPHHNDVETEFFRSGLIFIGCFDQRPHQRGTEIYHKCTYEPRDSTIIGGCTVPINSIFQSMDCALSTVCWHVNQCVKVYKRWYSAFDCRFALDLIYRVQLNSSPEHTHKHISRLSNFVSIIVFWER